MKNQLFVSVALLFVVVSFGQVRSNEVTSHGRFLISAGINFNLLSNASTSIDMQETDEIKNFAFALTPKAGYFIMDNLAAGLVITAEFGQMGDTALFDDSPVERTNFSVSAGPFVRYYLQSGFFGEASVGFGTSNVTFNYTSDNQSPIFQYGIGIGYALFINDRFSLEPLAQYNYLSISNQNVDFNLITTGIFVGIGFSAYL